MAKSRRTTHRTTRARRYSKPFFHGRGEAHGGDSPFFQAFSVQAKPEGSQIQRVELTGPEGEVRPKGGAVVFSVGAVTARQITARSRKGPHLPEGLRSTMEQGLGGDFSSVRIHADSEAARLSQRLKAQAFTHGTDVFFNAGKYRPDTREGRRLLAHELVHTRQQRAAPQKSAGNGTVQKKEGDKAPETATAPPALDRPDWSSRVKAARQLNTGSQKAEKEKQYRTLIAEALQSMPPPAGIPWTSPSAADIQIDFKLGSHAITRGTRVPADPKKPWKWIEFGLDALLHTPEWTRNTARHEFVHVKQYLAIWEQYQNTPEEDRGSWEDFMKPFNVRERVLGPEEMEAHLTTFSVLDQLKGAEIRQSLEGLYQSYFYTAAYQVPPGTATPISFSEAATQFVAGYQGSGNKADIEFYLVSAILRHGDTFGKDVFLRALKGIAPIVAGANGNSRAMKFLPSALSFVELTIEDILGTAKKKP